MLAVTGSALVFYIELDALLNPRIVVATNLDAPNWSSPIWDRALATLRKQWPDEAGTWSFEATGRPGSIPARYYPPDGHGHEGGWWLLWLTPDGEQVVRRATWGETLMTWLYDVHRNLLAGEIGNYVVGWLGVGTFVLLLSGLVVWWPRGPWRKALALKRNAAPIRRIHDLHKLFGLASVVLLLVLSGTGALLGLPTEKTWLLEKAIAPVVAIPSPVSTVGAGRPISIAQALSAAHAALPDARLAWIDVPAPGDGVFRIRAQVPGDPNYRFPHSYVFVDQYSGVVLATHDARRGTASTAVNTWIRPLHDASIGGLATRFLGVVVGCVPIVLFVTGILRWQRRRAARHLSATAKVFKALTDAARASRSPHG